MGFHHWVRSPVCASVNPIGDSSTHTSPHPNQPPSPPPLPPLARMPRTHPHSPACCPASSPPAATHITLTSHSTAPRPVPLLPCVAARYRGTARRKFQSTAHARQRNEGRSHGRPYPPPRQPHLSVRNMHAPAAPTYARASRPVCFLVLHV